MSIATDVINCNSSYVLIITPPFRRISERAGARPPAARVSILLSRWIGSLLGQGPFLRTFYVLLV